MQQKKFAELDVKIYYEDTDAGGIVYHANYLRYMERARVEWFATLGFEQRTLVSQFDVTFVVRAIDITYRTPARLEDVLTVRTVPIKLGSARLVLDQEIVEKETGVPVVVAKVEVACVDPRCFRPSRIPPGVVDRLRNRFPNL